MKLTLIIFKLIFIMTPCDLYIITSNINFDEDFIDSAYHFRDAYQLIFTDLESAKDELKKIYLSTPDFKLYDFKIEVYTYETKKYVPNNVKYIYSFDYFTKL